MAVQCLEEWVLFSNFHKGTISVGYQAGTEDMDTAMRKTQSLPLENFLFSRGNTPTNSEWSCNGVCSGCCEAPEMGHLIQAEKSSGEGPLS